MKAGTGISIGVDGTICATGGGGGGGDGVFSADANNNIWSCNTAITPGGATNNFLVGLCAGANLTGLYQDNNNFIGCGAGGNTTLGCNNNFLGVYSGQNEYGGYNNYIGFRAGKGTESVGKLTGWELVSATVLPGQDDNSQYYYAVRVNLPNGGVVQGWVIRNDGVLELSWFDTLLFSSLGPVTDGQTIVIPGNQIGGSSPADDATVILYADTFPNENSFPNENYASIAIGSYAASENNGDSSANIAIGNYAGQYTGCDEFNHTFIGTSAGRFASGGFYNLFIGAYAGECAGGETSFSNTFIGTFTGQCAANSFYQTHVGAYSGMAVVHPQGWTGVGNQLFGAFSGAGLTTGTANSMFGAYAGYASTTGTYNSFFGVLSGEGVTTGCYNAAFGAYSGSSCYYDFGCGVNPPGWRSSCGNYNTSIGGMSGFFQPGNSSCNVAVGFSSNKGSIYGLGGLSVELSTLIPGQADCSYVLSSDCFSSTTFSNQAQGASATIKVARNSGGAVCKIEVIDPGSQQQFRNYTCIPGTLIGGTASDNLPITSSSLTSSPPNTCNFGNTFLGPFAGQMHFFGTRNFFGGFRAGGWGGADSCDNVAIGSYAGFRMGGGDNIAIGCCAGALSGGYFNVAVGWEAGCCNSGFASVSIGGLAGAVNTADQSVFVGWAAGKYNTTGLFNTFVGSGSGVNNTTGNCNSFFGSGTGTNVTTGTGNTFIGSAVATSTTTGSRNVAVGCNALRDANTNSNNVAVGNCALQHVSNQPGCDWNVAVGSEALRWGAVGSVAIGGCSLSRVIGNCSTAVGYFALKGTGDGTTFLTSSGNSVFGWCSTVGITTGSGNSAFGLFSGLANSSGSLNTFFGSRSGCNNTTGGNNVAIGSCAGTDAVLNLTTQSNQVVIGNNNHTNAFIKIGWTVTSDERDKTCVTSVRHGLDFLDKITPVQYNWKNRENDEVTDETPRYGFLAQDILAAEGDPAVLVDTHDPENLKLRESMMIPVLVQAIKELHAEVKALKQQLQP